MLTSERKPSEHLVNIINMKELTKRAVSFLIGNGWDLEGYSIETYAPLGWVRGHDGNTYIIDTEGCGSGEPLENRPEEIGWYKKRYNSENKIESFSIMPFVETTLWNNELENIGVIDMIPLDKFVTKGGGRRDRNYEHWEKFLSTGRR